MAHHGSTPQRILDAPEPTREILSEQMGLNRAERRSKKGPSMKRRLEAMGRTNTPYRKDQK